MSLSNVPNENPADFELIASELKRLAALFASNPTYRERVEMFQVILPQSMAEAQSKHPSDAEAAMKFFVAILARYFLLDEWYPTENYKNILVKRERTPHSIGKKYAAAKTLDFIRKNFPQAFEDNQDLQQAELIQYLGQIESSALKMGEQNLPKSA